MWSHNVAASRLSARDTSNRARVSSSATRRGSATRAFRTARARVPDGEPSRYELSRSVIARASNDGVRVGTLERERGDGSVPGRFVSREGTAANRRAPSRGAAGGPAERRTQRRLDVSIHIAQMRHRERRATRHRARRRQKPIAPAAGSACPTALLTAPRTSDEVADVAEVGQRLRRRADLDGIAERGPRAVHLKRCHVRRHDRRVRFERTRRTHRGANRRGLRRSVGRGERRTSTVLVRRRAGERDGDGSPRRRRRSSLVDGYETSTHASARTYPSAAASSVLHRPSGASIRAAAHLSDQDTSSVRLTPPATRPAGRRSTRHPRRASTDALCTRRRAMKNTRCRSPRRASEREREGDATGDDGEVRARAW